MLSKKLKPVAPYVANCGSGIGKSKNNKGVFLSVVTYLGLSFTSTHFQNKAKLSVLNCYLSSGRAKGGRGRLIEV